MNSVRHGLRNAAELEMSLIALGGMNVSHHARGRIAFAVSGGHRFNSADPPHAGGVAFQLDNDVDGTIDLISDGLDWERDIGHGGQRLQAAQRVGGGVGVHGGQ